MQGLPSAALAIAAVISGCGKARNAPAGTGDTATVGSAPASDTGMAAHTEQTPPAGGSLNDANIVALLDEANKADSAAGALAATKATSPDVKAFARLMMSEHHALRLQGQQLAKKLGVTPAPPANDPLAPMAQQETSTLQSTPKGAEFDRAYIDQEVTVHKAVKDLLDQAKSSAQNDQLKDLITKAQPVIEKHLDQAESLQKKLTQNA
jgi:putative membrane protein